jgi:hypothetical protein
MKFKLSQTTKDFLDIIRAISSYLSMAGVGIVLIGVSLGEDYLKKTFTNYDTFKIIFIIFGVIIIIVPLIAPPIYDYINKKTLKKRKLSSIIIENQDIIIDIIDNGKVASFYEKIVFYKLGKNNNEHFTTKAVVSGTIEDISSLNCFYNLNHEKNKVTISYVNNTSKLNTYPSIIKGKDKFLIFSAVFRDTFISKSEYWDLLPIHYCISYNLQISLPEGSKIESAKIFKISEDNLEIEITDINPIIIMENGRPRILMQIIDYDYGEVVRLRWKLV